jgi:hypothetical protein
MSHDQPTQDKPQWLLDRERQVHYYRTRLRFLRAIVTFCDLLFIALCLGATWRNVLTYQGGGSAIAFYILIALTCLCALAYALFRLSRRSRDLLNS